MNLQEFERQTRNSLEQALNQLQTATLLLSALEIQILESGYTVQNLSRTIETFITSHQEEPGVETPTQP